MYVLDDAVGDLYPQSGVVRLTNPTKCHRHYVPFLVSPTSAHTTLPPHCRTGYQPQRSLSAATRNRPRPPSASSAGPPSSTTGLNRGVRGSVSPTPMSMRVPSPDSRSRMGVGSTCSVVICTAFVMS